MAYIRNEAPMSKIKVVNLWAIDHERLKLKFFTIKIF